MRPLFHLLSLTALIISTSAIAASGWTDLTPDKDLTGWTPRGGKATYAVEEGVIVGTSVLNTPNTFLCTDQLYSDFILEYEFKVHPRLNSGVQIRSEAFDQATEVELDGKTFKIPAGRVHGYQVEIDPDPKRARWWTAGIFDEARRKWLYPGPLGGDGDAFTEQG